MLLSGIPPEAPPFYPDFQAEELLVCYIYKKKKKEREGKGKGEGKGTRTIRRKK